LDPNIQQQAESVLNKLVFDNGATGGSIIVADPLTGKLLAIASAPTYDPNTYSSFGLKTFLNPITEHIYEPGSVFKVFTMAAGIDSGKLTPDTTYYDSGSVTINGKKITNYSLKTHGAYGKATMTNVIEHSINTGAVFAEAKIGNDIFTAYMKKFGLGEKTGVDLPGELSGNLKRLTPKSPKVAFATASYGQGVSVTPLGLLNAMAAIANGGTLMRPYLNSELSPSAIRRVLSTSTTEQVIKMMVSAVDKAEIAKIEGYSLAGKTGTAFIPDFVNGGYTDTVIDSFVGFGPASNPKFIVLVKVDTLPSTAIAATNVVPVFKEMAQYLINYYNIPPDRISEGATN
jgi:cell division protein FtsI/penicillin-binding protein 2